MRNAMARPAPSAITQAFVSTPPRERPSASRPSRSFADLPFEVHRLLSDARGCWCRPGRSCRASPPCPAQGSAASLTRRAVTTGWGSAPPSTMGRTRPARPAISPRSRAAKGSLRSCGAATGSAPWHAAGTRRSTVPGSSNARQSSPPPPNQKAITWSQS